jgi:NhaP-type Na+/H+ or K+/H+ antiporter
VALTLSLAVGSQVLASRLRLPALIVLLPVGFVAGALTDDVDPNNLLGPTFQPLVSLAVAVILFDAGLGLNLRKLQGHTRRVVRRLIVLGVPITWTFATLFAALLLGMSKEAAVMLGAILVVSGPTVVGPLLNFVRPTERVQRVLVWEGSLIDPVGGILGALTFHAVLASSPGRVGSRIGHFLASMGSAWPAASSGRRCCGCCCAGCAWARCSVPRRCWPPWSRWRRPATSSARIRA